MRRPPTPMVKPASNDAPEVTVTKEDDEEQPALAES